VPRSSFAAADRRTAWVTAFMVTSLALLAILQYRWTGEVERAEEERARAALVRAAWSVSGELQGELGRLYGRFAALPGDLAAALPPRLAAWRATALEPKLLREVLVARREANAWTLARWEESNARSGAPDPTSGPATGTLAPADWPTELLPLRQRLTESRRAPQSSDRRRTGPAGLVPALIAPLGRGFPGPGGPGGPFFGPGSDAQGPAGPTGRPASAPVEPPGILILWLDTPTLATMLLPELIARHFGDDVDYRIEVRGPEGETLYAQGPDLGRAQPDAVAPLFALHGPPSFDERPPFGPAERSRLAPGRSTGRLRRPSQRGSASIPGSGEASAQWQLTVTHPAGSLSAAVARARVRNFGISLVILAVLALNVLLVLLSARRAEGLARRQIELVAGVSHELLTPVAALRSAGENLAAGVVTEPEAVRRYGDLLVRESSRLGGLVEQVLTWAGLQSRGLPAAREPIEAGALLEGVAEEAAPLAQAVGVRIEVRLSEGSEGSAESEGPEGLPAIQGDRIALERALRNLLENALKYGASGGWISLGADRLAARRGRRPGVALWVEDRGPGVDAIDLPHLFEPFYRGRNGTSHRGGDEREGRGPVPGTGLGLALVQQIAREHGGRARVAPASPHGLRFTLELPERADGS
jgi:two-component system phosphate regulon sensor histidine kinase PhoR